MTRWPPNPLIVGGSHTCPKVISQHHTRPRSKSDFWGLLGLGKKWGRLWKLLRVVTLKVQGCDRQFSAREDASSAVPITISPECFPCARSDKGAKLINYVALAELFPELSQANN